MDSENFILSLLTLFLAASTALANSCFYINDFEVEYDNQWRTVTMPIAAHFDARVNEFDLSITYPYGLCPVKAEIGSGMQIW